MKMVSLSDNEKEIKNEGSGDYPEPSLYGGTSAGRPFLCW